MISFEVPFTSFDIERMSGWRGLPERPKICTERRGCILTTAACFWHNYNSMKELMDFNSYWNLNPEVCISPMISYKTR